MTTITGFLEEVRAYTDWAKKVKAEGRWLLVNGTYGPSIVFAVAGDDWRQEGRIFTPFQAVTVGWDELHDNRLWHVRPKQDVIQEALELSTKAYNKIRAASSCVPGYNKRLRADLLLACGLPRENP